MLTVIIILFIDSIILLYFYHIIENLYINILSTYVYQNMMLRHIIFGLGNAAAVFVFLCAFSVSLFFVFVLRAQSPTGVADSGLQAGAHEGTGGGHAGAAPTLRTAVGGLLAILFLSPLAWVFWVSVTSSPGGGSPTSQVTGPSLLSYPVVLFASPLAAGLLNSAVIAGAAAALTLILACPAAYALGRFGLPHANGLLGVMLAVAFFPPVAVLVPLFVQLREAGLLGTHLGAVIPHAAFFLPFAIWLLATFFRDLPSGVEDAARVDGAGRLRVLTAVILPLATPSVVATGAFVFVLSWNELVFASTFTLNGPASPVTVVLADLVAQVGTSSLGALAAGSLIAALPPVVLFLTFRRKVLAGLTGEALGEAARPADDGTRRFRSRAPEKAMLWAATAVFGLAGAWTAYLFARHGLDALAFPYPLNYGEGPLLDQAARMAELRTIYPSEISEPPYAISNYPPLFLLLQSPLVWLFGPAFWYGRALSLVATAAVAALIALTLHTLKGDRVASAAAGLTFLAVPFVLHWSSLVRVDMTGLALSWAGLYAVTQKPAGWRTVILASLLFVAAAYTRQTFALAAPLAAFAWLLARRRRREALALAALLGGLGLSLLAVLSALTGGGFFLHTVVYNLNEFDWERVGFYLGAVQSFMPVLLVGGLAFLVLGLRSRDASWWLVGSYLVGAATVALTIGKIGSDVNYLLELSAALSLSAGALLARYARRPGVRCAMLLALTVQITIMVQSSQFFYVGLQDTSTSQRNGVARLEEIVDGSQKPVLADEYAGLLPVDGRRIYIQPFEFSQLAREGKWDQRPFVASIRDKSFDAILIFEPTGAPGLVEERWTPQMLEAIEQSYRPTETVANTTVYKPR